MQHLIFQIPAISYVKTLPSHPTIGFHIQNPKTITFCTCWPTNIEVADNIILGLSTVLLGWLTVIIKSCSSEISSPYFYKFQQLETFKILPSNLMVGFSFPNPKSITFFSFPNPCPTRDCKQIIQELTCSHASWICT